MTTNKKNQPLCKNGATFDWRKILLTILFPTLYVLTQYTQIGTCRSPSWDKTKYFLILCWEFQMHLNIFSALKKRQRLVKINLAEKRNSWRKCVSKKQEGRATEEKLTHQHWFQQKTSVWKTESHQTLRRATIWEMNECQETQVETLTQEKRAAWTVMWGQLAEHGLSWHWCGCVHLKPAFSSLADGGLAAPLCNSLCNSFWSPLGGISNFELVTLWMGFFQKCHTVSPSSEGL